MGKNKGTRLRLRQKFLGFRTAQLKWAPTERTGSESWRWASKYWKRARATQFVIGNWGDQMWQSAGNQAIRKHD